MRSTLRNYLRSETPYYVGGVVSYPINCATAQEEKTMADLADDLKVELAQLWTVGFLDRLNGGPVQDDQMLPVAAVESFIASAMGVIESAAPKLAAAYPENPQTVYDTVYAAGVEAAAMIEARKIAMN